jgi:hypothetical protein
MSFVDGGFQNGNTAQYVGPYAGATVVQLGELQFRFRPGVTIMVPEVAMVAGTKSYEYYGVESFGSGGALGKNGNAVNLVSTAWESMDIDNVQLADGSDRIDVILTPTDPNDGVVYRVVYWIPTPQKIVIHAELFAPAKGLVLNDPANQLVVHHHRVSLGDNPTVSTFNGQTYKWSEWTPAVTGQFMTVVSGTMAGTMGLNWRPNAAGNAELYGDGFGGAETWKLDLTFTKIPSSSITRFGNFS